MSVNITNQLLSSSSKQGSNEKSASFIDYNRSSNNYENKETAEKKDYGNKEGANIDDSKSRSRSIVFQRKIIAMSQKTFQIKNYCSPFLILPMMLIDSSSSVLADGVYPLEIVSPYSSIWFICMHFGQ